MVYSQTRLTRQVQALPQIMVLLVGMSTFFACLVYPAGDSVSLSGKVVRYWAFHLQGVDGGPLDLIPLQTDTQVDLAVIDYSRDASEQGEFSSAEIQSLKDTGKIVLAYMPMGAADAGRFYDQNPNDTSPFSAAEGETIVGPENPSFKAVRRHQHRDRDLQCRKSGSNAQLDVAGCPGYTRFQW